ncbi:response regulator transcription factor [Komagataeibacter oboediens]|uniref:DNA-binding response regulator n=1 Tax=Komagataeibacter oboediens TaxID=65958 RepID=A0A318R6V1_9PROT|nr:response regulator transcription factor [Komagataeibacter oboediens]GBR31859.1 two component response regulator KdpE [Komagataeibacter oboediens DSM 11826]MBV0888562.1 response regulator transcription factor [Komagataeibacter oboediens]MBV1825143.1 response regulator transcription factor [Komagataeibacter oboediens]MCK9821063.1 response regulator transcription factor [Komagataeibacter oboediens]PYD81953.1 DNA-binding response regulator [Komagataeibacter oboediens]
MRILIVEDEHDLGAAVQERVRLDGHAVDWFTTLEDARAAVATVDYDFMLLDLGLPDGNGRDLLREIRRTSSDIAILITTAEDQISDRIAGLSDGADDYIVKPYDLNELVARIAAVARRYATPRRRAQYRAGDIMIDRESRAVLRNGQVLDLTAREWAIMELLSRHPGRIYSRQQIDTALYALDQDVDSNTVEVFISRLRKKVGTATIRTVRGRGYCLADGTPA